MKTVIFFISILVSISTFSQNRVKDIPLPDGYKRIEPQKGTFANYLQNLPLAEDNTVYLYNGQPKSNQSLHYAVIDLDVGNRDLQQCADAVMRLRAEYLFSTKQYSCIHFNFLGDGKPHYYTYYVGNDRTYSKFRKYLNYVFAYANTASLYDEMHPVVISEMQIGDVFIQKGRPYGHAIIVVDMAQNIKTREKIFLIAQSFMPAQSIHILKNFNNSFLNPWYPLNFGEKLYTPEWVFTKDDLRRFTNYK